MLLGLSGLLWLYHTMPSPIRSLPVAAWCAFPIGEEACNCRNGQYFVFCGIVKHVGVVYLGGPLLRAFPTCPTQTSWSLDYHHPFVICALLFFCTTALLLSILLQYQCFFSFLILFLSISQTGSDFASNYSVHHPHQGGRRCAPSGGAFDPAFTL